MYSHLVGILLDGLLSGLVGHDLLSEHDSCLHGIYRSIHYRILSVVLLRQVLLLLVISLELSRIHSGILLLLWHIAGILHH